MFCPNFELYKISGGLFNGHIQSTRKYTEPMSSSADTTSADTKPYLLQPNGSNLQAILETIRETIKQVHY